jgi:hypothetical protein
VGDWFGERPRGRMQMMSSIIEYVGTTSIVFSKTLSIKWTKHSKLPLKKISRNEKETDHCRGWRSAGIHPRWKSKKSTEKRETTPQHTIYTGNSLTKTVVDVFREREMPGKSGNKHKPELFFLIPLKVNFK